MVRHILFGALGAEFDAIKYTGNLQYVSFAGHNPELQTIRCAGENKLSIVLQTGVTALVGRVYQFYYHRIQEVFKQDVLMHK